MKVIFLLVKHQATIIEIKERFAINILRKIHFNQLIIFINDIKAIGCNTIFIDGSFVTDTQLPHDIDICWDNIGVDLNLAFIKMPVLFDMDHPRSEQQRLYHADIFPAFVFEADSMKYFIDFFQKDKKSSNPKGIIKLEI